jgi:hypothetical protein
MRLLVVAYCRGSSGSRLRMVRLHCAAHFRATQRLSLKELGRQRDRHQSDDNAEKDRARQCHDEKHKPGQPCYMSGKTAQFVGEIPNPLIRRPSAQRACPPLPTRAIHRAARGPWSSRLFSGGAPHGRSWLRQFKHSRQRVSLAARVVALSHPEQARADERESTLPPESRNCGDSGRHAHR